MTTMNLTLKEGVHVLTLTNGDNDNTLSQAVLEEYHAALDQVEAFEGNTSLLITSEHAKTFTTGINLEWLGAQDKAGFDTFIKTFNRLIYRLVLLNVPTVAGINGNCYAGGALVACAMDFRVMRSDRGRFCLPEVNIKIPFTPVMVDCINQLPNKQALKQMALTGIAYTGEQCKALDIVDEVFPQDQLQGESFTLAKELAQKDRATYTTIKRSMRLDMAKHNFS